jgi:hypothetical protein
MYGNAVFLPLSEGTMTFTRRRAGAPSITTGLMSDFVLRDGASGQRRFEALLANRYPEIAGQNGGTSRSGQLPDANYNATENQLIDGYPLRAPSWSSC